MEAGIATLGQWTQRRDIGRIPVWGILAGKSYIPIGGMASPDTVQGRLPAADIVSSFIGISSDSVGNALFRPTAEFVKDGKE
jgi:hypothetical protein